jgi:hypothetical protein
MAALLLLLEFKLGLHLIERALFFRFDRGRTAGGRLRDRA